MREAVHTYTKGFVVILCPLKTEEDHQQAMAEIERLFEAVPNTADGDRLDALARLVEAYEEQHHPIPLPDPIAALEYHLESRGLNRRDLQPYLGSAARVEDVLSRRRGLTIHMIRRLHRGLGISADVLIQPYPLHGRRIETAARSLSSAPL